MSSSHPGLRSHNRGSRASLRHQRLGIPRTAPPSPFFWSKTKCRSLRSPETSSSCSAFPGSVSNSASLAPPCEPPAPARSPTSNINKHLLQPRITGVGVGVSHGLEFFKVGQQTTAHACTHSHLTGPGKKRLPERPAMSRAVSLGPRCNLGRQVGMGAWGPEDRDERNSNRRLTSLESDASSGGRVSMGQPAAPWDPCLRSGGWGLTYSGGRTQAC